MSEETKESKKEKQQSEPTMFEAGDVFVIKPESNKELTIPTPSASYTEYKASEETQQIAFQSKKREYLKSIATHDKFVVFLDSITQEQYSKNPIAEPKYNKQIILQFNADISNRQYSIFNKLRAEVQDMERTSLGSITDYKEMGVTPPEDFAKIRINRYNKEKELYDVGLRIFFKYKRSPTAMLEIIPEGMIDLMEMRSTRDLIDAMDIRLNLGIRDSPSTSTDISSTKKNTSLSIQ